MGSLLLPSLQAGFEVVVQHQAYAQEARLYGIMLLTDAGAHGGNR